MHRGYIMCSFSCGWFGSADTADCEFPQSTHRPLWLSQSSCPACCCSSRGHSSSRAALCCWAGQNRQAGSLQGGCCLVSLSTSTSWPCSPLGCTQTQLRAWTGTRQQRHWLACHFPWPPLKAVETQATQS